MASCALTGRARVAASRAAARNSDFIIWEFLHGWIGGRNCNWTWVWRKGERGPQGLKPAFLTRPLRGPQGPLFHVHLKGAGAGKDFQGFDGRVSRQQDGIDYGSGHGFGGHHFAAWGLGPKSRPDVGVGGAGEQGDDADSARAQFQAQGVGEAEGAVLGSVVGGGAGEDSVAGDGEIVH